MTNPQTSKRRLRSWRWLLPCAAIPPLATLLLGALGGRNSVQILTGTQPLSDGETLLGAFYILSTIALTFLSPVCVLAAGMIAIRDHWVRE